jgi:hypothetical protein
MQKLVLTQEMPSRKESDPDAGAVVPWTTLHALPFHCSTSVVKLPG